MGWGEVWEEVRGMWGSMRSVGKRGGGVGKCVRVCVMWESMGSSGKVCLGCGERCGKCVGVGGGEECG